MKLLHWDATKRAQGIQLMPSKANAKNVIKHLTYDQITPEWRNVITEIMGNKIVYYKYNEKECPPWFHDKQHLKSYIKINGPHEVYDNLIAPLKLKFRYSGLTTMIEYYIEGSLADITRFTESKICGQYLESFDIFNRDDIDDCVCIGDHTMGTD